MKTSRDSAASTSVYFEIGAGEIPLRRQRRSTCRIVLPIPPCSGRTVPLLPPIFISADLEPTGRFSHIVAGRQLCSHPGEYVFG